MLPVWILGLGCLVTGLAVVALRHQHRTDFLVLQGLRAERDRLNAEWSRLSIEEALVAQHARIEKVARDRLDMHAPAAGEIRILRMGEVRR